MTKKTKPTAKEIAAIKEYLRYNLEVTLMNEYEHYISIEKAIKANKGKNLSLATFDKLVKQGYNAYVKKHIPARDRKYLDEKIVRSVSKRMQRYWAETIAFNKKK